MAEEDGEGAEGEKDKGPRAGTEAIRVGEEPPTTMWRRERKYLAYKG